MRNHHSHLSISCSVLAALLLLAAGCGTTTNSTQLMQARDAYDRAASGEAGELAPEQVLEARGALQEAEDVHASRPGSPLETHLAYLAHRKALEAVARADRSKARIEAEVAERDYFDAVHRAAAGQRGLAVAIEQTRDRLAEVRREQKRRVNEPGIATGLREIEHALAVRLSHLERERDGRREASMAGLADVAEVRAVERRWVLHLDDTVLFAAGSSEVLAGGRDRLAKIAEALKQLGGQPRITVACHTDSVGSEYGNVLLSQSRADAVRDYLVERGLDASFVEAVGQGAAEPVATNDTAEGRARNRRVVITVE